MARSVTNPYAPCFDGTGKNRRAVRGIWLRTLANGETVYYAQLDVDGKTTRRKLEGASTLTEAKAARAVLKATLRAAPGRGELAPAPTITLRELLEEWKQWAETRRAPSTIVLFSRNVELHAEPLLERPVAEITHLELRELLARLQDGRTAGVRCRRLAPASVASVMDSISALFRYARRRGYVTVNPIRELDSEDRPAKQRQRQPVYLTAERLTEVLDAVDDDWRPFFVVLAGSGLRTSELIAARWGDVELEAGLLHVDGQLDDKGGRREAKTEASTEKPAALLPMAVRALRELRRERAELGIQYVAGDALIFVDGAERPLRRQRAYRALKARTGINPHALRHSYIAGALAAGATLPEASRLARHSSVAVTAKSYAGLAPEHELRGLERLVASGWGA
jgi:integrase